MIHIPADMSASIVGGSGLEPTTVRAAHSKHGAVYHSATRARLYYYILVMLAHIHFQKAFKDDELSNLYGVLKKLDVICDFRER